MNRTLLFCAFFAVLMPCLALAQSQTQGGSGGATGIEGVISAGPAVGGPTRQGGGNSRPVTGMEFDVKKDGRTVTSFHTDEMGRFRVILGPGRYTVVRKGFAAAVGSYGPFEVDVAPGKMSSVKWECDTGLR